MSHTVITIARQYGSGGKTVGKMLAEDLGIHFYDREIIRLASDESGISEQLLVRRMKRRNPGFWAESQKRSIRARCFLRTVTTLFPPIIYSIIRPRLLNNWRKKSPVSLSDVVPIMY